MMHITIYQIYVFVITYLYAFGLWQFISLRINKKGYKIEKQDGETFFDFMCRYYADNWIWKIRKKLNHRWIYNSKIYGFLVILKGVFSIIFATALLSALIYMRNTDYGVWLNIEF
jgi:hypothetical protein